MESEATTAARSASVRDANDRLCASAVRLKFADDQRVPFACECGDIGCLGMVMLTIAAYGAIREERCRFLLLLGHEHAAEERVVVDEGGRGYVVIEKSADQVQ
jgi:hypothetical protein